MTEKEYDLLEDLYEEDYFDFDDDDDTAKCGLCGYYYCTCCGCDCWMNDYADEYEDEEETEGEHNNDN